mmetsp:Transcript_19776/g.58353  ORF Transcript_19776/g.58353 Transcript_19776/m.58353 type:complete len:248 (+) Transcript_19776:552-1295(+)
MRQDITRREPGALVADQEARDTESRILRDSTPIPARKVQLRDADSREHFRSGRPGEWNATHQQEVRKHTKGPEVSLGTVAPGPGEHLRGCVRRGSHRSGKSTSARAFRAGRDGLEKAREAVVDEFHRRCVVIRNEEDVLRFDVSVHDALCVEMLESTCELAHNAPHTRLRQSAARFVDRVQERATVETFGDEKVGIISLVSVEELHNVLVHTRSPHCLRFQPLDLKVSLPFGDALHRHLLLCLPMHT